MQQDDFENENFTGRIARSGAITLFGKLGVLLANFIATPFIIRLLGSSGYGLWSLLQSLMSYLSLADLGMTSASTKFAGERYATGDNTGEASAVWTSLLVTSSLTASAALILWLLAPVVVKDFFHLPIYLIHPGVIALKVVALTIITRNLINSITTPQTVRLRWMALTLSTSGITAAGLLVAPIAIFVIRDGVVTLAGVYFAIGLISLILSFFIAARMQPKILKPSIDIKLIGSLFKYGGALGLSGLAAIPLTTLERFFLAHNRSASVVGYYAVAMYIGQALSVVTLAVTQPLFPVFVRLKALEKRTELSNFFKLGLQATFVVLTPACFIVLFLASPFLRLWAGPRYGLYSSHPLFFIIAGVWLNSLAQLPFYYLLSAGKTATIAKVHLAELVPFAVVAYILTYKFGATGAAVAWSGRILVDTVIFLMIAIEAGLPLLYTPSRKGRSLTELTGFGICCLLLAQITDSLVARVFFSLILIVLYLIILWKWVLTSSEEQGIRRLMRQILSKESSL
jgi:O-antigen/teichoic acid export membrane protein